MKSIFLFRAGSSTPFAEGNRYNLPSQPGGPVDFRHTSGNMVVRKVMGVAMPR
jgi:hypothetical protein